MEFDFQTYVDAHYAHKAEDRRSVSGVAVCCGGTLVSWFSRTRKYVTLSTTEAEYVAMANGVKEALHVTGILAFLMPSLEPTSISVCEDNQGAIDLAKKPLSSSNSKHILTYGTIFSGSWLPGVTAECSIFERKISMRIP